MVQVLDDAVSELYDPPESRTVVVVSKTLTGKRGRPRLDVNVDLLSQALQFRGPSGIARSFNCCARTIRRRLLEAGLVGPAAPPFSQGIDLTGQRLPQQTSRPLSSLTDEQLDVCIRSILQSFPLHGRALLNGALTSMGHHVPTRRIEHAAERIRGVSGRFGQRMIHRRKYNVRGPLSLVHHDGQHGTLRLQYVYLATQRLKYHNRVDPLSNAYPLFHRRLLTGGFGNSSQRQQPRHDSSAVVHEGLSSRYPK